MKTEKSKLYLLYFKKIEKIINEIVEEDYNITPEVLWSSNRRMAVAFCRQCIYYTLHKVMGISSNSCGEILNKDHGTILYGAKKIQDYLDVDPQLGAAVRSLSKKITDRVEQELFA
tara:strand:+ start:243 stop:590 length:348 start_codon:yes stop_codon:yes gene_type:complete